MPTGSRIRANNVYGVTQDNPLSAAAATFNSVSLPLLPVVASAHAIIVLDPKRVYGDPEIVVVTAHTAASTVATILRGQYNTSARQHPQGTSWAHVPVTEDWIQILTSVTRPTDPYRGQTIFETNTNRYVSRSTADTWQQMGLFFDPPACKVKATGVQLLTNGGETAVAFGAEDYDTDNMHDNAANNTRITFNTPGLYVVTGTLTYQAAANGQRQAFIRKNASGNYLSLQSIPSSTFQGYLTVAATELFIAGDFVELRAFVDGASVNTVFNSPTIISHMSATWIGRGN